MNRRVLRSTLLVCASLLALRAFLHGNTIVFSGSVKQDGSISGPETAQELEAVTTLRDVFPNILIVEPYHGLGNRLRAYASAAALARKSGRHLVVVWIPDVHVNARLSELFDITDHVVFDFAILSTLERLHMHAIIYDYNSKGGKDKVIKDTSLSAIYVRSAYVLQSETVVSENDIRGEIQKLRPITVVTHRVSELTERLKKSEVVIGVHIRMQSNIEIDVPGIDNLSDGHSAGSSAMGPVKRNRDRCHYNAFIPHIKTALERDQDASFLVASDENKAIIGLQKVFGNKIISLSAKDCTGPSRRGVTCLQNTLVEFFTLSAVSRGLILSDWSSSSELIRRLTAEEVPHVFGCYRDKKETVFNLLKFSKFLEELMRGVRMQTRRKEEHYIK
mmetsp:Transcript_2596/g.11110  ORF Transcript_2596/g.11110 Transcript_2596/m.11110 type:complete len:390 (+) Transcript_2596:2024-3193(+)